MFRISGDVVAYTIVQSRDEVELGIRALDVRSGRLLYDVDAVSALGAPSLSTDAAVTDLVLGGRGATAWISRNPYAQPPTYEVFAVDRADRRTQLDTGPDIAPRSLALSEHGALYWRNGSEVRTGVLPRD